jgi:alpha-glucosidase (family GH31 glycosyl hydrolase)
MCLADPGQFALPATNGCPTAVQKTESTAVLLWSNMIYDSMISKTGRRPLVLSRYGGVGNQRYGIGFFGDTVRSRIKGYRPTFELRRHFLKF